jgi:hypothetical protein
MDGGREEFMRTGRLPLKIIAPGWGTSGYYGEDILQQAAQDRVFKEGLHMYWDHPTIEEAATRPERSLRDLAAVFRKPATYERAGKRGPGLYTEVEVFKPFRESVWDMAQHIGPSIRALGPVKFGEAEGKQGPIVEGIIAAQSVDFVTAPGRGGEILQLFEAARPAANINPPSTQETNVDQLQEAQRQLTESQGRITTLEESVRTLTTERDTERAGRQRAEDALILREARDFVAEALSKVPQLPDITKTRLIEAATSNPPVTEDRKLDTNKLQESLSKTVKSEVEYIASITGAGIPKGLGNGGNPFAGLGGGEQGDPMKQFEEAMRDFGLGEADAAIAARGRVS